MTRWLLFAALLLGAAWWLRRKPVWHWPEQSPLCQPYGGVCVKRRGHRGDHRHAPYRDLDSRTGIDNYEEWLAQFGKRPMLPVDPWPQSQTYTLPDGSIFLIGEPGDPWTLVQADPTYTWLGEPVRR